jgi:RimJ/RimL family protein N-acetyltransferase
MVALFDLSNVALTCDRLALRSFRPADAPELFNAATLKISRYMTWDPCTSLEAFGEVWREWLPSMAHGSDLYLVIRLASSSAFLGVVGLHKIGCSAPEVGIWIGETSQRLGYGREAIAAIAKWAATHVGAAALIYAVVEQNYPSRRLAESLRGVPSGKRALRKASGNTFDEIIYRLPAAP